MLVSLLDRSRTRTGASDGSALAATVERAAWAERAGYHRFWVAEHHAVPGIASGAPAVLLSAIGARTSRIRLGSAGVMLPNHTPLVVTEQFLMLDAMYPGRIDLGVGRSLGFTPAVRSFLRADTADRLPDDLDELRALLDGTAPITARPAAKNRIPLFVLATGRGVRVAATLGLPVVIGGPALAGDGPVEALEDYRRAFVPSERAAEPRVLVSTDILIADTDDDAARLALSEAWAMAESRRTGEFPALRDVTEVPNDVTPKFRDTLERSSSGSIHGSETTVARELEVLIERTGADEIVSSASTFDRAALRDSDERLVRLLN